MMSDHAKNIEIVEKTRGLAENLRDFGNAEPSYGWITEVGTAIDILADRIESLDLQLVDLEEQTDKADWSPEEHPLALQAQKKLLAQISFDLGSLGINPTTKGIIDVIDRHYIALDAKAK